MSHYPMLDRCDYAEHGLRGDTYFIPKKHFLTLFRKKLKTVMIFFLILKVSEKTILSLKFSKPWYNFGIALIISNKQPLAGKTAIFVFLF